MSKPVKHYGKWRIRWNDEHGARTRRSWRSLFRASGPRCHHCCVRTRNAVATTSKHSRIDGEEKKGAGRQATAGPLGSVVLTPSGCARPRRTALIRRATRS